MAHNINIITILILLSNIVFAQAPEKTFFTQLITKDFPNVYSIAQHYDYNFKFLLKYNKIQLNTIVHLGDIIKIPNNKHTIHVVNRSDKSLWRICKIYNVDIEKVKKFNKKKDDIIKLGDQIIFPSNWIKYNYEGIWVRKEYVDILKKEKKPIKGYLSSKDLVAIIVNHHNKNRPYFYINILDQYHDFQYPIEMKINTSSMKELGYKASPTEDFLEPYTSYFHQSYDPDFNPQEELDKLLVEYNKGKGFSVTELEKKAPQRQEQYFLKRKGNELTLSIKKDSILKFYFTKIEDHKINWGWVGPTFYVIPDWLHNSTIAGKYHVYNSDGKQSLKNVILTKNGEIKNWKAYNKFQITLCHSKLKTEFSANLIIITDKSNKKKTKHLIFERHKNNIFLYTTKCKKGIGQGGIDIYTKKELLYKLRPSFE